MNRRGTIRTSDSRSIPVTWLDPVAGSPIEIAVGGLFLTAGAVIAMVWGAAYLSSLLIHGVAADLGVADAGRAVARMGSNRLSWDGAWAPEVEQALAGPRWFWLFFAIEALVLGLLFWPAWRLLGPRVAEPMPVVIEPGKPLHPRKARRDAQRADRAERQTARRAVAVATGGEGGSPPAAPTAAKIVIDQPTKNRLVLGRVGNQLVATEKHHSVLALGPTRSGKTSGLALPAILEWDGPAVVVSAKSDVIAMAWGERTKRGGVTMLYDPTAAMADASAGSKRSFRGNHWSPLDVISTVPRPRNEPELDRRVRQWSLARRSASWMVSSVRAAGPAGSDQSSDGRYGTAEQMLAPLLLAAAADEAPIGQVVDWVDRRDDAGVRDSLERAGVTEAGAAWDSAHRFDSATTTAAYQILTSVLLPFGDPVAAAHARHAEISATALLDGDPNTLFVLSTPNHQTRLRPLLTTLIHEVFDAATSKATVSPAGRLPDPLLVVIDDAGGCLPVELLNQLASRGAGIGVQLLTLIQDLGHLSQTHGGGAATHLADSHRARVVLPGITDPFSLDYLNTTIRGNRLIDPDLPTVGDDGDLDDDRVVSATASWMRTLDDNAAVLIYGNLAPIRIRLRPWFGDEQLRQRLVPTPEKGRWLRKPAWLIRRANGFHTPNGFPNPLDSDANNREATRYWDSVVATGMLPEAMEFNDGTNPDSGGRTNSDPF